jgi:glucosyltransferase GtrII-like protein
LRLFATPLEHTVAGWWGRIDPSCRRAFVAALAVNVLAFGWEMTNLTLHHDDVSHLFIQDTILGHYLGRFGHGWLHMYTQNHYLMPFLQMAEGIVLMSVYGVVIARFWGLASSVDIGIVAAIICVFPYMAHLYQYNTSMATYPAAHLLVALAVVTASGATIRRVAIGALLFVAAFSIYQAVIANAATIFVFWLLSRHLFGRNDERLLARGTLRATVAVLASVLLAGTIYLGIVAQMHIEPDKIHSSEEAFRLAGLATPLQGIAEIWQGTRSFFVWPENYYPQYLKALQGALLVVAGIYCLWLPRGIAAKLVACAVLAAACIAPRMLQLLAPKGHFHSLALTGYAVVFAGAVMIIHRGGGTPLRNASIVATTVLLAGYVIQNNWISTVNYLNTLAHVSTLTQVLARARAIPDAQWDGRKIAVVGTYDMSSDYPYKPSTGVANKYMDAPHMELLARVLRDPATFVEADASMPNVLAYAASHPRWPDPASVGVVDGMAVVVFANRPGQASP